MITITDYTIASGSVAQKLAATTDRTPCAYFWVQNKHASANLHIKLTSANSTTDSLIVAAGQVVVIGGMENSANVNDLNLWYAYSTTATHPYAVLKGVA